MRSHVQNDILHFSGTAHPVSYFWRCDDLFEPLECYPVGTWGAGIMPREGDRITAALTDPSFTLFCFAPAQPTVRMPCRFLVLRSHSLWNRLPTLECWWPVSKLSAHTSTKCHKLHSVDGWDWPVPLRITWTQVSEDNLFSCDFF